MHLRRLPPMTGLAQVVPQLEPLVLHEIVRRRGLEESGEIVALATSEQLLRVFDVDLWGSDEPGGEERFDADRFGRWLEVLHEAGPALAARKVAEMDLDFVTGALAEHLLVLDGTWPLLEATVEEALDEIGQPSDGVLDGLYARHLEGEDAHEVGGYRVLARRAGPWDALLSLLVELDASHRDFFSRLMGRLARVSTELLDDEGLEHLPGTGETAAADLAAGREERREADGYVTPVMATAFLSAARDLHLEATPSPPAWDHVTAAWSRAAARRAAAPGAGAVSGPADGKAAGASPVPAGDVAGVLAAFRAAGAHPEGTPLLPAGRDGDDRLGRLRAQIRHLAERDGDLHARRMEELGFVSNVLVAGASFNARPFRPAEAARAASAVCNLGLENWPRPWLPGRSTLPADLLVHHDLVSVFRVGWSVLHERVGLHTARALVQILSSLATDGGGLYADLAELRNGLRRKLEEGTPWHERDNLDALAALDLPTWSVLVGLVDQCPVVPSEATGFEFIAENSQVEWVHAFLRSLPDRWEARGAAGRKAPSVYPGPTSPGAGGGSIPRHCRRSAARRS